MADNPRLSGLLTVIEEVAGTVNAYTPCGADLRRKVTEPRRLARELKNWTKQARPGNGWGFHRDRGAWFVRSEKALRIEVDTTGTIQLKFGHAANRTGLVLVYDGEQLNVGEQNMLIFNERPSMLIFMFEVVYCGVLTIEWSRLKGRDLRMGALEDLYRMYVGLQRAKEEFAKVVAA